MENLEDYRNKIDFLDKEIIEKIWNEIHDYALSLEEKII